MIDNRTPYAADRNWTRDVRGRHHWIVAVRATFDIRDNGQLALADHQPPPALAPEYRGVPGASSLRWDSDVLYMKPTTDVIAEAQAYTDGRKRASVSVRLRCGPINKELLVYGPRSYQRNLLGGVSLSEPEPFVSRPITYESAYGGTDLSDPNPENHRMDERNPIGVGFAVSRSRLVGTPGPSVEYPGRRLHEAGPAGFGPIDPAWLPRRAFAGTYDQAWANSKQPLLPDDYDERFGCCAPADQRLEHPLHGGEPVELVGLTPDGLLRFHLPRVYLTYRTYFGSRSVDHRGKLVTVVLLADQHQVAVVWQTTLAVSAPDIDYLDRTVIDEKPYLT